MRVPRNERFRASSVSAWDQNLSRDEGVRSGSRSVEVAGYDIVDTDPARAREDAEATLVLDMRSENALRPLTGEAIRVV